MSLGTAGFSVRGRMDEIAGGWIFRVRHVSECAHWESVINTVVYFQGTPKGGGGSSKGGFPPWWGRWRPLSVSLSQIRHLTQKQPRLEGCSCKRVGLLVEREESNLPEQSHSEETSFSSIFPWEYRKHKQGEGGGVAESETVLCARERWLLTAGGWMESRCKPPGTASFRPGRVVLGAVTAITGSLGVRNSGAGEGCTGPIQGRCGPLGRIRWVMCLTTLVIVQVTKLV